jgi:hypothetical protein
MDTVLEGRLQISAAARFAKEVIIWDAQFQPGDGYFSMKSIFLETLL